MTSSFFPTQFGADTSGVTRRSAAAYLNLALNPQVTDDSIDPDAEEGTTPGDDVVSPTLAGAGDEQATIIDFE